MRQKHFTPNPLIVEELGTSNMIRDQSLLDFFIITFQFPVAFSVQFPVAVIFFSLLQAV
jgi:hypothetical protein